MNLFKKFTNQYALTKTLRFELKPIGKTLENMRDHFRYDKKLQTFLKDQEIEDAYQTLKPKIDDIHEKFITDSLESEEAKKIHFSGYLDVYKNRKDNWEKLGEQEKKLRSQIGNTYKEGGKKLKEKYPSLKWKKGTNEVIGTKMLASPDILEAVKKEYSEEEKIEKALKTFKGFFTYFGGFNQNRENYYITTDEKATAIATRIIHENLPKFCDNILIFEKEIEVKNKQKGTKEEIKEKRKLQDEYLNAYKFLKDQGRSTKIKDAESGEMIEAKPITKDIFEIIHFPEYLSQPQIEKYNKVIGHYNLLINLYNQAKGYKKGQKLSQFKTLYNQIGCGKKDPLFFSLTHDTEKQAKENKEKYQKPYSVEQVLEQARKAGKKFFNQETKNNYDEIDTVFDFTKWLKNNQEWEGVYWSKAAVNTISNKYFANWHEIKDKLKNDKTVVSYNKKREEQIKINDAVELAGLFMVLDEGERKEGWSKYFFKPSVLEDRNIDEAKSPSQNLINLLSEDIEENAKLFNENATKALNLKEYKSEKSKKTVKAWMDYALAVNRMIKYFLVKPNKIKGAVINAELTNALDKLLDNRKEADWFKWYDSLRNYLTKRPQDDAKENKLKLNFECPSLLGGWSDGQEKVKKSVILKNDGKYYLGVLKKSSIFDTTKDNNLIYTEQNKGSGRLILANLKFQTLAGRGFIRDFSESYGEMGRKNPLKAVKCLQKLISRQYVQKYKKLKQIVQKEYQDKKEFDKDIQQALKDCYLCEFAPINWSQIIKEINEGNLYVFEIFSKDWSKESTGRANLQTLYWKNIFEKGSHHQLNGGGEIFYRKKAIKEKKVKEGYKSKPWVIEGKRFTENSELEKDQKNGNNGKSFFLHCPIKINYKAKSYGQPKYAIGEINQYVNQNFSEQEDIYFLGLDRGEKHLVYYSLVDKNGKIVDQGSFNKINGHNYQEKLAEKEKNRDEARKNWQTIGNIKNLKEGYISQVVHEIVKIVTDKPTYIVLEDLNTEFKRGRQKIERQVYQKFEVALAKKLNFIVDKTVKDNEVGSVTNALQLTPPIQNYQDIENKKQAGIMLYTRANYTSQTDPVTGWRKTIYLKKGSEKDIKDQIAQKFSDIGFENGDYFFEYTEENIGKKQRLWSGKNGKSLLRYRGKRGEDKNEWIIEQIDIVKMLDKIFDGFDKNRSFWTQIFDGKKQIKKCDEKFTAWESLRFAIDLIQQIRNSGDISKGQDDNFLLSPVRDKNENHFDSRKVTKEDRMPVNADANGSFNIARKGILMNEHIKIWTKNGKPKYDKNSSDLDLFISDKEWDLYLKNRKEWESKLSVFSSRKKMEENRKKFAKKETTTETS